MHVLTEMSLAARMSSKSSAGDAFYYDDMRQACGKELGMLPYVVDSFPDVICHLISGYISQFTCKAHITAPLTSQKVSVFCLQNAGLFTMEKVL